MPEKFIFTEQRLKKGGQTPEFINLSIATQPVRLRFGPTKNLAGAGSGSALLLGSKTLLGSPNDITYQVTRARFNIGTPSYFAVTHSREGGTIDTPFVKGDFLNTGGQLDSPIYSLLPGTIRVYALGPGSSVGGAFKFKGLGSVGGGLQAASFSADLYPL